MKRSLSEPMAKVARKTLYPRINRGKRNDKPSYQAKAYIDNIINLDMSYA
jgi:hypothetical protein